MVSCRASLATFFGTRLEAVSEVVSSAPDGGEGMTD
jgi:hypothetical protein